MIQEIKLGEKYGVGSTNYRSHEIYDYNYKRYTLDEIINKEYIDTDTISTDMIVHGGYINGGGGHAISFRFLLSKYRIIFCNSGEGLNEHPNNKEFYQLYYTWQFPTVELFNECSRRMLAAMHCAEITNIIDAYKYQVNIMTDYRTNSITFKDNGIIKNSRDIWMTDKSNWNINEKGVLHCKPQLTGTCSFHSMCWQFLLDIWNNEGSLATSKMEEQLRNITLNSMIDIGPYRREISENNSCLALLLRIYPDIKDKENIIKTLMYNFEKVYSKNFNVSTKLPTNRESRTFSHIDRLSNLLKNLHKQTTLNKALPRLLELLAFIRGEGSPGDQNAKDIFHSLALQASIYVSEIKEVTESNTKEMEIVIICFSIHFLLSRRCVANYIHIMSKLHSSLPQNKQLTPFFIDVNNNYYIDSYIKCDPIVFFNNYNAYLYDSSRSSELQEKLIDLWQKNTPKHKGEISRNRLIQNEPGKEIKYSKVYDNLMENNPIAECVSAFFIIMEQGQSNNVLDSLIQNNNFPLLKREQSLESGNNNVNVVILNTSLALIADLHSGVNLKDAIEGKKFGLSKEYLARNCFQIDDTHAIKDNLSNVIPDVYFEEKKNWIKEAWIKAAPQILEIANIPDSIAIACSWLFYLWPEGPSTQLSKKLLYLTKIDNPSFILKFLLLWLTRDYKFAPEIDEEEQFDTLSKTIGYNLLLTFGGTLFYLPEIATQLLSKNIIISNNVTIKDISKYEIKLILPKVKESYLVLFENSLYPKRLRQLRWEVGQKDNYYSEDGKDLVLTNVYEHKIESLYYNARRKKIICCLWKKKDDLILELEIAAESLFITEKELTLPSGEKYKMADKKKVPFSIRQWSYDYETCISLPLYQKQGKLIKWFFLITGGYPRPKLTSVFDKDGDSQQSILDPIKWFIFEMQPCNLMPILNRNSQAWEFLNTHLIRSVKVTCLALIRSTVKLISDVQKYEDISTPVKWEKEVKRNKYTKYLSNEYNLVNPIEGDYNYRLCYQLATMMKFSRINTLLPLLLNITYTNLEQDLKPIPTSQAMFETVTGKFLRPNQIELLNNMKDDLTNKSSKVRIALMGIGKSKVLVPMLIILCILNSKAVTIIQPSHLVPQTLATLDEIIPILFNDFDYNVVSDTTAKSEYLIERMSGQEHKSNRIVIMDEVDSMYNPSRSDYNIPSFKVKHAISNMPLEIYYKLLVSSTYKRILSKEETDLLNKFPQFQDKFKSNLIVAKQMKHLFHYGASDDSKMMLSVPYMAVETPVPGASFSDIDLTGILSCYQRKKGGLTLQDCELLVEKLTKWQKIFYIDTIGKLDVKEIIKLGTQQIFETMREDEDLQMFYLEYILLPDKLYCNTNQYNISFIDLMAPDYAIQRIGFSGTEAIHLPEFKTNNWTQIVPDRIGEAKIKASILGWSKHNIFDYTLDNLWSTLTNPKMGFTALIDADALLRKQGSSLNIVQQWAQKEKATNKDNVYVFINNKHVALEYNPKSPTVFNVYKYREDIKFRWYFDQKHTIGTDLKLEPHAKALTLVNKNSKLTDVAQAIYRLRQIGKDGQSTEFMLKKAKLQTKMQLYNMLKDNDDKFKNKLLSKHFIQNAKTVERSARNHNVESYMEKVKYYDTDVIEYNLQDPLAISLLAEGVNREDKNVNIEVQHEQEKEEEKELEVELEQEFTNEDRSSCNYTEEKDVKDTDYLLPNNGTYMKELNISISSRVDNVYSESKKKPLEENTCFIFYKNHCKVITINEALILKARNKIKIKDILRYRNDEIPNDPPANYILATAVCGRHLPLHEQLYIIKHLTHKKSLLRLATCYYTLRYDIIADYLNSSLSSKEYLANFTRDYSTFVKRWLRIPIVNKFIRTYWQKCMTVLDTK